MELLHVKIVYFISLFLAVVLTAIVWQGKKRPIFLVVLQGAFELIGLGMLTFYIANVAQDIMSSPDLGSIVLGLAAVLMLAMLTTDKILGYNMPKLLPVSHLASESIGLIMLFLYI